MGKTKVRALYIGLLSACAIVAGAQDTSGSGRYGSVSLESDFQPDPHSVTIVAGGSTDVSENISGCVGLISANQPDYEVEYSSPGDYSLGFYVTAQPTPR